jgi:hypothetical protein
VLFHNLRLGLQNRHAPINTHDIADTIDEFRGLPYPFPAQTCPYFPSRNWTVPQKSVIPCREALP